MRGIVKRRKREYIDVNLTDKDMRMLRKRRVVVKCPNGVPISIHPNGRNTKALREIDRLKRKIKQIETATANR